MFLLFIHIYNYVLNIAQKFREFLSSKDFVEIEMPKLMAGSSEGGAAVFKLLYHGQPACLTQAPFPSPKKRSQNTIPADLL